MFVRVLYLVQFWSFIIIITVCFSIISSCKIEYKHKEEFYDYFFKLLNLTKVTKQLLYDTVQILRTVHW